MQHVGRPLLNAVLLGAFAALGGLVTLQAVHAAIDRKFSGAVAASNNVAPSAAFDVVRAEQKLAEDSHA